MVARTNLLSAVVDKLPDSAVRDRIGDLVALELPPLEIARRFGATGHVVDTVPLALFCAQSIAAQPFSAVLARTISVGGDTDTIASITGQIAGTVVGRLGVPYELFVDVTGSEEVNGIAESFAQFVAQHGEGA
jgi:ADP-ribosyl-[dinitrogen reductase] hydrolase